MEIFFFCHHKLFGLQATLEFRCIDFEPTHPLIGISLCKVLTSLRSALCKWISRYIPIVTTPVGYLGSEVFNLIPHSHESILLVLPPFSVRFAFCLCESRSWLAHHSCAASELSIAPYVLSSCTRAPHSCLPDGRSSLFMESN
jgi:hypothetical protein